MISSINDVVSIVIISGIVVVSLILSFRSFLIKRKEKMIEEEIEYYKEW